ncbi:TniQ family protein [Vibrio alginolyticus]
MLTLTPFPDESIYSYIYRLLLINGIRDFRGILTANGFKSYPWMPKEYSYLLRDIKFEDLSPLYRSCRRYPAIRYFNDPFEDIADCRRMLFEEGKSLFPKETIPIRYCRSCIEQSIYENGVAYFKAQWTLGDLCIEHNQRLEKIDTDGASRLKSALSRAYKGDFNSITENKLTKNVSLDSDLENDDYDRVHIPPCARSFIASKIISSKLFYSDRVERLLFSESELDLKLKHHFVNFGYRDSVRRNIEYILEDMLEERFDEFLSLLDEHMEIARVVAQKDGWGSFERTVLKPVRRSCARCVIDPSLSGQCSAQNLIMITRNTKMDLVHKEPSYCKGYRSEIRVKAMKILRKKRAVNAAFII